MTEPELLSAVICTRNRPDLIAAAVGSVLANDDPNFELIVIDQSTDDSTRLAIGKHLADPRLRYIHTTRAGLSAAYNRAIAEARGNILAFTDDDCVAPRCWLSSVRAEFERFPGVDLIYGEVRVPPDAAQGVHIPGLRFACRERLSARDGFRILGMGANFAVRRRSIEACGGFDEALGGGGPLRSSQDFDLQYRYFRGGLVSLVTPAFAVDHYGARTPGQWAATLYAYGFGDGAFYMKHIRCFDVLALWLYSKSVGREIARVVVKRGILRRPHPSEYLKGLIRGALESFRFPIDRRQRMYVLR